MVPTRSWRTLSLPGTVCSKRIFHRYPKWGMCLRERAGKVVCSGTGALGRSDMTTEYLVVDVTVTLGSFSYGLTTYNSMNPGESYSIDTWPFKDADGNNIARPSSPVDLEVPELGMTFSIPYYAPDPANEMKPALVFVGWAAGSYYNGTQDTTISADGSALSVSQYTQFYPTGSATYHFVNDLSDLPEGTTINSAYDFTLAHGIGSFTQTYSSPTASSTDTSEVRADYYSSYHLIYGPYDVDPPDEQPANRPPITSDVELVYAGGTHLGNVGFPISSDPDGDTLRYSILVGPEHGQAVIDPATGTYAYIANERYVGDDDPSTVDDTFYFLVEDGKGGRAAGTVGVKYETCEQREAELTSKLQQQVDVLLPERTRLEKALDWNEIIIRAAAEGDSLIEHVQDAHAALTGLKFLGGLIGPVVGFTLDTIDNLVRQEGDAAATGIFLDELELLNKTIADGAKNPGQFRHLVQSTIDDLFAGYDLHQTYRERMDFETLEDTFEQKLEDARQENRVIVDRLDELDVSLENLKTEIEHIQAPGCYFEQNWIL